MKFGDEEKWKILPQIYFKVQIICANILPPVYLFRKRTKRITLFWFCVHFARQTFDSLLIYPTLFAHKTFTVQPFVLICIRNLCIGNISNETFVTVQRA